MLSNPAGNQNLSYLGLCGSDICLKSYALYRPGNFNPHLSVFYSKYTKKDKKKQIGISSFPFILSNLFTFCGDQPKYHTFHSSNFQLIDQSKGTCLLNSSREAKITNLLNKVLSNNAVKIIMIFI